MKFVKAENIKKGMRLARPIYSKSGVLLFDRDSIITSPAIDSIRNYDLLGIYVLEPAEPLPPMSEEDIEFERFQVMTVGSIQDELEKLLAGKSTNRIEMIAGSIIKKYGHLDSKINFYQNLRSNEDFIYRHSLNVAILCAMLCHALNLRLEERTHTVCAAIVHDYIRAKNFGEGDVVEENDVHGLRRLYENQLQATTTLERNVVPGGINIRRICAQALKIQMSMLDNEEMNSNMKILDGTKILLVANRYDELTAMNLQGTAKSEVKAIKELLEHPEIYDPMVVDALIRSINILAPGVSIELSTGEKAMVLVENKQNVLRPMVLSFRDNSILDLSLDAYEDIYVEDVMKTLDNRYVMDIDTLHKAGF